MEAGVRHRSGLVASAIALILAGGLALLVGIELAQRSLADGRLPIRGAPYRATVWAAALLVAGVYGAVARPPWRRVVGLALMLTPIAQILLSILNDLAPLLAGGTVLAALSERELSNLYTRKLVTDLGYVGIGFLFWSGWQPREGVTGLARRLRATGVPVGDSEKRGITMGSAWFPVLLVGVVATDSLLRGALPQLVNSDETSVWDNMTPFHAIMISAAAAVGEEIVYRLLMMGGLMVLLGRAGIPRGATVATAMSIQVVVFGLAHGGYGNWLHVIQAGAFAIIAGFAVLLYGIWGAVMLHFLVDIFAFGVHVEAAWWQGFLVLLLLVLVATGLVVATRWAVGLRRAAAT